MKILNKVLITLVTTLAFLSVAKFAYTTATEEADIRMTRQVNQIKKELAEARVDRTSLEIQIEEAKMDNIILSADLENVNEHLSQLDENDSEVVELLKQMNIDIMEVSEAVIKALNSKVKDKVKKRKRHKKLTLKSVLADDLYWEVVHYFESQKGKSMYQGNYRTCKYTASPCGHHQIAKKALIDLKLYPKGMAWRTNYTKSLKMAKDYTKISYNRLSAYGKSKLTTYERWYQMHNLGVTGFEDFMKMKDGKSVKHQKRRLYAMSKNVSEKIRKSLYVRYKKNGKWIRTLSKRRVVKAYDLYWKKRYTKIVKRLG
jgi:hypothetical protein